MEEVDGLDDNYRPDDFTEDTEDQLKLLSANGTDTGTIKPSKNLDDTKNDRDIYSETVKQGVVDKEVFIQYLKFGGGILSLLIILASISFTQVLESWNSYFVSDW